MSDRPVHPRKIYLIGANSYIAAQIRRHFTKFGHRITGISHTTGFVEPFEDGAAIINCSASYQPASDLDHMVNSNFLFAKKLIERCNNTHTVINLASYFELGNASMPGPVNNYATAKLLLRAWLTDFARTKNIQAVNLLLYDIVGPEDQRNKLVPNILKLNAGDEIKLTRCEQIVNLIPVENVIEAISRVLLDRSVSGLAAISNVGFKPLKEYIGTLQSVIGFTPVFGAIPYGPAQIFEPVRNIPAITAHPSVEFDLHYVTALRDSLGPGAGAKS